MKCVMCDRDIDVDEEEYEVGESLGEYWCNPCAARESDTGEIY